MQKLSDGSRLATPPGRLGVPLGSMFRQPTDPCNEAVRSYFICT
jgi:hypothetical protein